MPAALLATLLVGALRNGRRRGFDLAGQAAYAGEALAAEAPPGQFVTGQLLRIDLPTGTARVVNAGHPFPLRLRDGRVEEVELEIDAPFGVSPEVPYRVQSFPLEPGDRLVFLTDGMQERNAASLDVERALAAHRRPAPARGGARAGCGRALGDRRGPARRRHDGLPGLVRRSAALPRHRARGGPRADVGAGPAVVLKPAGRPR